MTDLKFSPQVLSSRENLANFFEANKAADKKRILNPPGNPGKWERIAQCIKTSFLDCYFCFEYLKTRKFTHQASNHVADRIRDSLVDTPLYEGWIYPFKRNDVLVRTSNDYQQVDTDDIYMQKPILLSKIRDQRVRECINFACRTSSKKSKYLDFTNIGYCYGNSLWFAALFFETRNYFPNTLQGQKEHFKAVANLFTRGAPRAATLLQALQGQFEQYDFLNVQELIDKRFYYKRTAMYGVRIENIEELAKEIKNIKPGFYLLKLTHHAMIYEKLDGEHALLFDPSSGVIQLQGREGEKKLAEYVIRNGPLHFKRLIAGFFMNGAILGFRKLVPLSENHWLDFVKIELMTTALFFTFPLRVCYFWVIGLVNRVYARSISAIREPFADLNPVRVSTSSPDRETKCEVAANYLKKINEKSVGSAPRAIA